MLRSAQLEVCSKPLWYDMRFPGFPMNFKTQILKLSHYSCDAFDSSPVGMPDIGIQMINIPSLLDGWKVILARSVEVHIVELHEVAHTRHGYV
mmetsp:Transcript_13595/g.23734  ORF Transcript_13595/g.23734 Transcript_13595/m.23734 type:complete len:93 (-) Transcript_13595:8-286(-)